MSPLTKPGTTLREITSAAQREQLPTAQDPQQQQERADPQQSSAKVTISFVTPGS